MSRTQTGRRKGSPHPGGSGLGGSRAAGPGAQGTLWTPAGHPARPALASALWAPGGRWGEGLPSTSLHSALLSATLTVAHVPGLWPRSCLFIKWGPLFCPAETSLGLQAALCSWWRLLGAWGGVPGIPWRRARLQPRAGGGAARGSPGDPVASDDSPHGQALGWHGGPVRSCRRPLGTTSCEVRSRRPGSGRDAGPACLLPPSTSFLQKDPWASS